MHSHVDRIRAGEVLPVDIEVIQRRRSAAELFVIPYNLPPGLNSISADGSAVPVLKTGSAAHVHLGIQCSMRGTFTWGGFRAETDYPLGLVRAYRNCISKERVLVYPRFTPLERLNIPVGRRYQPGGVAMSSDLGESFEYIGNRDYREGDSVRNIDWVATARLNTPIVREYRDEYFLRVGVVLDTHVASQNRSEGLENFERAVSVCASVSDYMARSDYLVDIFAAGPNLYHLTAGRSLAYLEQILDILACVEYSLDEPFSIVEPELTDYLSRLTTVVCVLMNWDENRRDFVHRLATQGTGIKVIIVRDGECSLMRKVCRCIRPNATARRKPTSNVECANYERRLHIYKSGFVLPWLRPEYPFILAQPQSHRAPHSGCRRDAPHLYCQSRQY